MSSVLYLALAFISVQTVTSLCPNGWTTYDDECYLLMETPTTWLDAETTCGEFEAKLATLNTQKKIDNVRLFLKDMNHKKNVFVGATDMRTEGVWSWVSDLSRLPVTDWAKGEPDHGSNENCLILLPGTNYQWADAPCSNKYDYLCERKST